MKTNLLAFVTIVISSFYPIGIAQKAPTPADPEYITNPFWAVGNWPYTISWDTSYSSDIIVMLDPQSLKQAILTDFR